MLRQYFNTLYLRKRYRYGHPHHITAVHPIPSYFVPQRQEYQARNCEQLNDAGSGVLLLDCSSNGTFVNGERALSEGMGTALRDGDRVSLVLSVNPLVELYFIFHAGMCSSSLSGLTWPMHVLLW